MSHAEQSNEQLAEVLRLEAMLFDITSNFVNVRPEDVHEHIEIALRRVAAVMNAQSASLLQFMSGPDRLEVTHAWTAPEAPVARPFAGRVLTYEEFPWLRRRLDATEPFIADSLDDLPAEAEPERAAGAAAGIKSIILVPFELAGGPRGVLELGTTVRHVHWPRGLVPRLRHVGHAFAVAVERERSTREAMIHREALARLSRVTLAGELVASIAHQLRQPLAAIVGNAGAARRLAPDGDTVSADFGAALDDIVSDANRAADIIQHLRELLRPAPPTRQTLELNEVVEAAMQLARANATQVDVSLETNLARTPLPVEGDPIQLEQVVLNMVANAGEAMQGQLRGTKRITVSTAALPAGQVELVVADTGPGIPADRIVQIFEPFITSKPGNLGMGLGVCRSIVEAHGGRIEVESTPGAGSVFRVTL